MSLKSRPFEAVIFDVDGVLAESMPRHYEAYRHVFQARGVDIEPLDVYLREGKRTFEVISGIAEEKGLPLSPGDVQEMARVKQEKFASFGPQALYPGARELVERLHASGVKLGVASGTHRVNLERHLGEFLNHFDAVVAAEDVGRSKPDPEPYLCALEKLGVPPERGLVIENAPLGIRAGKGAGARVYAVASTLPPERLKEADAVFSGIAALAEHLETVEGA